MVEAGQVRGFREIFLQGMATPPTPSCRRTERLPDWTTRPTERKSHAMRMKTNQRPPTEAAWTKWELLLVVFVVGLLAVMLVPALLKSKARSSRVGCVNNVKQVSTSLRLFANDNDSRYPDASTNITSATELWKLFQVAQNDIFSPRVLVCPDDKERTPAADFLTGSGSSSESFADPSKRNLALSYFYAAGADEASPSRILIGDRNLTRDPARSDDSPGTTLLSGTQRLGSTREQLKGLRFAAKPHERWGNLAFMDGSARQLTSDKLREALGKTGDTNNLIWLPQ